jgi:hypothetical protein
MKQPKTHKNCQNPECGKEFKLYKTTDKFCSFKCAKDCEKEKKPKTIYIIPQRSKKKIVEDAKYTVQRIKFLAKPENQKCFIEGCNKRADTIEHSAGRKGFYDDWARDNGITLYLDERFWKPCCNAHNLEMENNSELSKKYQLSKIHGGKKE